MVKCNCFLPRFEDCKAYGFPEGCYRGELRGLKRFRVTTPGYSTVAIVRNGIVVQSSPILQAYVGLAWKNVKRELRRGRSMTEFDVVNLDSGGDLDNE